MKSNHAGLIVVPVALLAAVGCGRERVPPRSLLDARMDYMRAQDGIAMQLDPADVHEADVALERAEKAWRDAPGDAKTADLALLADRKALIALSHAETMKANRDAEQAAHALEAARAAQLQAAQGQLSRTEQALGATQMQLQQQQQAAAAQQQRLAQVESNLREARETISKIASVKDDDRGMVITLQGEVLFNTGKSDLKAAALAKLDEIADALKDKEQPIAVYGYTDNVGTHENNMDLSQRRADAVRSYLVSKGIPQDLVTAQGKGPDFPITDNQSVEGRAQNRRVEIVVRPKR